MPAYSVIDLLERRTGQKELTGRSVVMGAHAVELGDNFTVSVHGILSGPLLQIIAAETISQGIELVPLKPDIALLVRPALLLFEQKAFARKFVTLFGTALLLEASGAFLQLKHSLVIPTTDAHLATLGAKPLLCLDEFDPQGCMARLAGIRATNTQRIFQRIVTNSTALADVADTSQPCAIFVFNLHCFKSISLTLGRQVGDLVLACVARRLREGDQRLSPTARLDSDTFALFATFEIDSAEAEALAGDLADLVSQPVDVGGTIARVGARIGFNVFEVASPVDAITRLAEAEAALDEARLLYLRPPPSRRLQLEISESRFLEPKRTFLETLHDLRMLGVALALDDFGSGFSSFGYLAPLPLDKIKLDRVLIQNLYHERASEGILKCMLKFYAGRARSLSRLP